MRVKGPVGGPPPVDPTSSVDAARATEAAPAATAAAAASEAGAVQGAAAAAADPVAEVARRLRAGEINAREALEALIDDAVERQLGQLTGDRKAIALELKNLLRRYSESDPYLASKVRRLESHKR